MPITLTYDIGRKHGTSNAHAYLRTTFERFRWKRRGKSVLVYDADPEDWLNDVIPALMFFRAFVEKNEMTVEQFVIHVHSLSAPKTPAIRQNVEKMTGQSSREDVIKFLRECCQAAPLVSA